MQTDYQAIQRGVTALSYARSQVYGICSAIRASLGEAKRANKNARFRRCARKIEILTAKMEATAKDMDEVGQKLSSLANIVARFENQ